MQENSAITDLVKKVSDVLLDPFIALVFAAAFIVFMWGVAQYLYYLNIGDSGNKDGKMHMFWGIVGMFIMTAAWTLMKIIDATVGSNYVQ